MKHECTLPASQDPVTKSHLEPDTSKSSPHPHTLLRQRAFNKVRPYTPGSPKWFLLSDGPIQILHAFLSILRSSDSPPRNRPNNVW